MRYLGIDFGSKKVGLAVSDDSGRIAFPFDVLLNDKNLLNKTAEICQKEQIDKIVCGLSLNFSGEENAIMPSARAFCEKLSSQTGIPVEFENEILTSVFAGQTLKKDKTLDARAAAIILQRYLDRFQNKK
jgi:putative Holliday junction resolvase